MVRRYDDRPVDPAIVDRALANATHAPSAGFSQGWAFLRLDQPDDVRRFWRASTDNVDEPDEWLRGLMTAPVVIVPCSSRAAYLDRYARVWTIWTVALTVPFVLTGLGLLAVTWLTVPVAAIAFAQAWINPELYAFRGASVLRPKGERHEHSEPVAQGLLGDLLGHDERDLQRATGVALQRGAMGVWMVGEAGAILLPPGGKRAHCLCVRVTDPALANGP